MERLSIHAEKRDVQGKGVARSLRRDDMIPAVLYRAGKAQSIKLARKELAKLINTLSGEQVIVDLHFADGEKKLALLKDFQVDPVNRELLHTDFFEVSLTEAIRVTVHVVTVGEPIGVKRDAGILQHALREVEIECLPDKIPGKIDIDIAKLELGQSVHVSDLKFEEGIKVLTDPGDVIVTVIAPVAEAAPVEEAAAPVAAEPEVVVKKGKKEEGAAEKKEK
ncbi:MAG: ribosomal protein Ctc-form [Nitrospirae bacterium]|nr:ribosomal protein Ctc-form [Nitrospirota bacterium]